MSLTLAEGRTDLKVTATTVPVNDTKSSAGDVNDDSVTTAKRINWFKKTFPHFFTAKVVENRGTPLPEKNLRNCHKEIHLTRKVGPGCHDFLRVEQVGDYIRLVCKRTTLEWKVGIPLFKNAAHSPSNVEWVGIRTTDQPLMLRRSEVLIAARSLGLFGS